MPTLLNWRGHRFFFYSADRWEPPHVHITRQGSQTKIWLRDLTVAINIGYSARELNEIIVTTRENRDAFLEAWNDHFGT